MIAGIRTPEERLESIEGRLRWVTFQLAEEQKFPTGQIKRVREEFMELKLDKARIERVLGRAA